MEIVETLRLQANEIADEGYSGCGNTMSFAADEIDRLRAHVVELEKVVNKATTWFLTPGGGSASLHACQELEDAIDLYLRNKNG